jgi:predicted  nucleic acid-binding Zn-ribbon protein
MTMTVERDAYVEKLKGKLNEWNAEIDRLKAKAEQAEAESKIRYSRQLNDLKEKRRELESKIAELQKSGESAWENLKEGVEKAWESLKEGLAKAKSQF